MSMSDQEIQEWATAFIKAQLDENLTNDDNHPQWWAVEKFMDILSYDTSSQDAWKAILAVLKQSPPDKVIGMLAAGPLEDLIECYGEEVIDDIEKEAGRNPAFKNLLGGVWKSGKDEVWARVEACRGEPW